jgi:hypothetical protein
VTLTRGRKAGKVCSAVLEGLARRLFGCYCPGVPRPPVPSGTHFEENKGPMREDVCAKHLVGWTGSEVADVFSLVIQSLSRGICLRIVSLVSCGHGTRKCFDNVPESMGLHLCLSRLTASYLLSHEIFTLLKQTQQTTHPRLSLSGRTDGASHHVIIVGY